MSSPRVIKAVFKILTGFVWIVPQAAKGDTVSYRASALVGGYYNHIAIDDRFVYAATRRGLEIFTKRGLPIGSWGSPGDAQAVAIAGDHAYLADGDAGVWVVNVTERSKPVPVGHFDTGGNAYDVALAKKGVVLVADGTKGVRIVDVGQPARPREIGAWVMANDIRSVAVKGSYAYAADLFFGVHVLDISKPVEPREVGSCRSPGSALAVAIAGNRAFLADGPRGLRVIDISNPTQPFELGAFESGAGSTQGVMVDGERVFLAEGDGGLRIVEITEPSRPTEIGWVATNGPALDIGCIGEICYVAAGDAGIRVFDVGRFPADDVDTLGRTAHVMDVDGAGDYWAVATGRAGVRMLNLANADQPVVAGAYADSPDARVVAMRGPVVYVGDFNTGVKVLDIKNPSQPQLTYTYSALDAIFDMTVNREFILTASGKSQRGLHVLTSCATCPGTRLQRKSFYKTSGAAWSVVADSQFAYLADNDSGVVVIDWHDMPGVKRVSRIGDLKAVSALAQTGDYLLAAEPSLGLRVYDISQPDRWKRIGALALAGPLNHIAIDGHRAFIAAGRNGIVVVDISRIDQPAVVGTYDTPGEALRVRAVRGMVVVADRYSVEILNCER